MQSRSCALLESLLESLLEEPSEEIFAALFDEIDQRAPDEETARAVAEAYEDGRCEDWLAAELLARCAHPAGSATLRAMLDESRGSAHVAARALVCVEGAGAEAFLIALLVAGQAELRNAAAYGLGALASQTALEAIADAGARGTVSTPEAIDSLAPSISTAQLEALLRSREPRARALGAEVLAQLLRSGRISAPDFANDSARLRALVADVLASEVSFFRRSTRALLERFAGEL